MSKTIDRMDRELLEKMIAEDEFGLLQCQFKKWFLSNYDQEDIENMANHGCRISCIHGLIYYHDITAIYVKHKEDLWRMIDSIAEDMGYKSSLDMINSCDKDINYAYQLECWIVWACAEHIAQQLVNQEEE